MATITPVLWKSRENKKGESPIYLRIEAGNRRQYQSLRVYVKPRHWNAEKGQVRKTHPLSDEINDLVQLRLTEANRALLRLRIDGDAVTPAAIKKAVQPTRASEKDFIAFGYEYVDELRRDDKLTTAVRYDSILRKVARFHGKRLPFSDLDNSFMRRYQSYMVSGLDNNPSTRASNFRAIRAMINRSVKKGLLKDDPELFEGISFKESGGEKRKLGAEEIQALQGLELEGGSPAWRARSYWMFSMYLGGMRFRDVAQLKVGAIQDGRLSYKMSKTGKHKNIDIPPAAMEIVNFYNTDLSDPDERVFPILSGYNLMTGEHLRRAISSQNAYVNKLLKEIAALAKIFPQLSFHQSRHSFANLALADGWSVRKIQAALGHKDITTTERYLRELDAEFTGKEMGKLFSE